MNDHKTRKRNKQKHTNVLVQGISDYILQNRLGTGGEAKSLDVTAKHELDVVGTSKLPKRYTIYEPMVLLGSSFPTHTPSWQFTYASLTAADKHALFSTIAKAFCRAGHKITHIALNAPIQLTLNGKAPDENMMRLPINLQPLHSDFGPSQLLASSSSQPTQADFNVAFWVTTSQVSGIKQVWAPRWIMFSRGNISEKARILGRTQQNPASFPGLGAKELGQDIGEVDIVDFYVGIGYFAIPFLKRGVRRVFGWEINAWSVEGLRRGCEENDISCEVVQLPDNADEQERNGVIRSVVDVLCGKPDVRCVIFRGDNSQAAEIMCKVGIGLKDSLRPLNLRHCNLGLLPTSQGSWQGAVKVIDPLLGGWLHVHENADVEATELKKQHVVAALAEMVEREKGASWQVSCEHVEMVKTYAPGVGHFVLDIKIWPVK